MEVQIGRLVAAGNQLKSLMEFAGAGLGMEAGSVIVKWDAAVEDMMELLRELAKSADVPRHDGRDFDYLAFDSATEAVIGFGSRAIFALQYADEAAPESEIAIIYAGSTGRAIWEQRFPLRVARPLIVSSLGQRGPVGQP